MKTELVSLIEKECDKCHRPATHLYTYFFTILWFYHSKMNYLCLEHAKEYKRKE